MATFGADDNSTPADLEACQQEVHDLRAALRTRPAIDQTKGILMARHGCTADEAFRMLSHAAQRDNRKVRELAESIVAGAVEVPGTGDEQAS